MEAGFHELGTHTRGQLYVERILRPVETGHTRERERVVVRRTDRVVPRVVPRLCEEQRRKPDRPRPWICCRRIREQTARLDPDADPHPVAGVDRRPGAEVAESYPLRTDKPVMYCAPRRHVEHQRVRPRVRRRRRHHRVLKPVGEQTVVPTVRRKPVVPTRRHTHRRVPVLTCPLIGPAVENEIVRPHGPCRILPAHELHDHLICGLR